MSSTQSEILFEEFCARKRIRFARIEAGNSRSQDYEIFIPRRKVVVEVKQIVPNREERQALDGELVVVSSSPGHRVRGKIGDAVPQIKARTRGRFPGLLVLMGADSMAEHTSPYSIRAAMHGFESLILAVPSDPDRPAHVVGNGFGGGRRMTPASNTSLSAVAVMAKVESRLDLLIYHNPHAAIPLEPDAIRRYHVPQFVLAANFPGEVPGWTRI